MVMVTERPQLTETALKRQQAAERVRELRKKGSKPYKRKGKGK